MYDLNVFFSIYVQNVEYPIKFLQSVKKRDWCDVQIVCLNKALNPHFQDRKCRENPMYIVGGGYS